MQVKTTMRYYFTPVRMTTIPKSTNKCWQGCGEKGTIVHCWWKCRLVQPLWKIVWNFLRKVKMVLPVANSGQRCLWYCGCDKQSHSDCRSPVKKRDSIATLWERENADSHLDRLLFLSSSITSKKVLIHYVELYFNWLLLTDDKEKNVTNAREWKKWLIWLHSVLGTA